MAKWSNGPESVALNCSQHRWNRPSKGHNFFIFNTMRLACAGDAGGGNCSPMISKSGNQSEQRTKNPLLGTFKTTRISCLAIRNSFVFNVLWNATYCEQRIKSLCATQNIESLQSIDIQWFAPQPSSNQSLTNLQNRSLSPTFVRLQTAPIPLPKTCYKLNWYITQYTVVMCYSKADVVIDCVSKWLSPHSSRTKPCLWNENNWYHKSQ